MGNKPLRAQPKEIQTRALLGGPRLGGEDNDPFKNTNIDNIYPPKPKSTKTKSRKTKSRMPQKPGKQ